MKWTIVNTIILFQIIIAITGISIVFKNNQKITKLEQQYTGLLTPSPFPSPRLTPTEKILYTFHIHILARRENTISTSIKLSPENNDKTFTISEGGYILLLRTDNTPYKRILTQQLHHVLDYPEGLYSSLKSEVKRYEAVYQGKATILVTQDKTNY